MATCPAPDALREPPTDHPSRASASGGRSRVTATVRLILAVWLAWDGASTLIDPTALGDIAVARSAPPETVLLLAGLNFMLGIFLLSGFMCRIAGLVLAGSAAWQIANSGPSPTLVIWAVVGIYLLLRGGGTWAVDVYVEKMQERVRRRDELKRRAERTGA